MKGTIIIFFCFVFLMVYFFSHFDKDMNKNTVSIHGKRSQDVKEIRLEKRIIPTKKVEENSKIKIQKIQTKEDIRIISIGYPKIISKDFIQKKVKSLYSINSIGSEECFNLIDVLANKLKKEYVKMTNERPLHRNLLLLDILSVGKVCAKKSKSYEGLIRKYENEIFYNQLLMATNH